MEKVIGYIYKEDGIWEVQYVFELTAEKIVTFIKNNQDKYVVITHINGLIIYENKKYNTFSLSSRVLNEIDLLTQSMKNMKINFIDSNGIKMDKDLIIQASKH
ncbi:MULTISPECIES: hypothetical protein [unclassified Breznakia]|uniref:hypothetical protein n=1 Tax=unclassified Breznakia TaxID=2623764 RepID=UPI002476FFC0|nr:MULTISPECIES: hypothetical protein [unclassified Breznakia]MDH6367862.1 hypothetical protein [Breznakia sp. PH1-1]MDH6404950.1 hypothetical protein [Breznakia sp. PF1-11]MDH6412665.1 hypothetical protein [Breznakia sp. PFB1-11]MDH6415032.1 hypothetical protein [Breznakia sp. PFB1-14]MDH6417336.1 hypothetical protein [Breznakia sp. PFB1-4]